MIYNKLFSDCLVKAGLLDASAAQPLCEKADEDCIPLHIQLLQERVIAEETLYRTLADFLGLEYRFCQLSEIDLSFVERFPRDKLIEYEGVPLVLQDDTLTVLIANPFHIDDFGQLLPYGGNRLTFAISPPSQMKRILDYVNNKIQQSIVLTDYTANETEQDTTEADNQIDAPIIKLCDSILKDAVTRGASDIHIEPFERAIFVRFRIDGKLTKIDELSPNIFSALLARFKIMSELNIAERRIPQDGKINLTIDGQTYDFRVSTLPTLHGEKIVIRIYNLSMSTDKIDSLGFSPAQIELVMSMITRPHGIILLTGPTGSGKSTTLYTFLRYLNREDTNILTVEDPVENEILGINQVQVNTKANMTFAVALRSFLRQDPNVIMIGEIRDEETAQIATRAAITGHLVLSSVHTNDAAGVITRLINMGIAKYLVADSLLGAISQRLVRKLCPKCKSKRMITRAERNILGIDEPVEIHDAVGCPYCNGTGYLGRIGVFEIMVINDTIRNAIMSDQFTTDYINQIISNEMPSVLDNARERVLAGETTLEEYEALVDTVRIY